MKRWGLKKWESVLVLASLLMFCASFLAYVTDFSIRGFLFGIGEDEERLQVGQVAELRGSLRRESNREFEFRPVNSQASLYNRDTLVTGSGSGAKLQLSDGSVLEMGPDSMIRLIFEPGSLATGIARQPRVDLIRGKVTGQSGSKRLIVKSKGKLIALARSEKQTLESPAAILLPPAPIETPPPVPSATPVALTSPVPSPSPSATVAVVPSPAPVAPPQAPKVQQISLAQAKFSLELTEPKASSHVSIKKGSQTASKPMTLKWQFVSPRRSAPMPVKQVAVRLVRLVRHSGSTAPIEEEVSKNLIKMSGRQGEMKVTLERPGLYEWQVADPEDKSSHYTFKKASRFVLDSTFEGIESQEPLVGGELATSNQWNGKHLEKFDITLRWKPYPGARKYNVWIGKTANAPKPLLQKTLDTNECTLNRDKIYDGWIFYRVSAELPSGFTVHSETLPFSFNFNPPKLVLPDDGMEVSNESSAVDTGGGTPQEEGVLLTWQKTLFTDNYEIQLARDAAFKNPFVQEVTDENFYVAKLKTGGAYWWRVRSIAKSFKSPFGETRRFTFTPPPPTPALRPPGGSR